MVGPCKSLHDLNTRNADLLVICRTCRHERIVAIGRAIGLFVMRGWSTDWDSAPRRFRCGICGGKNVRLDAVFFDPARRRQKDLSGVDISPATEKLRPGLRPPPPGVALREWNEASELERKKMVDRARS